MLRIADTELTEGPVTQRLAEGLEALIHLGGSDPLGQSQPVDTSADGPEGVRPPVRAATKSSIVVMVASCSSTPSLNSWAREAGAAVAEDRDLVAEVDRVARVPSTTMFVATPTITRWRMPGLRR